jgi:fructose-bisphosphate aldolase class 1
MQKGKGILAADESTGLEKIYFFNFLWKKCDKNKFKKI